MSFRLILLSALIALCSVEGSAYGRQGKKNRLLCSGEPIDRYLNHRQDITALKGLWYNKFNTDNLGPSSRPLNVQVTFNVMPGSNRAEEIVKGNNPKDGSCLVWKFRDYEIYDGLPCYAEKGTDPETCEDEEWIHVVFQAPSSNNKLLFFYYCADADSNPNTRCTKYLARCLSRSPYINNADRAACRQKFAEFNLGELPPEDTGSTNNACNYH